MKTILKYCLGFWLVAVSTLHAQVPPPPGAVPPPAESAVPRTNITPVLGTNSSFFQRNTNFGRPRTDIFPATNNPARQTGALGTPATPTVVTPAGQTPPVQNPPNAAGAVPNRLNIPGLQTPPVTPSITATSANFSATNIVPRGSTNDIPTRMLNFQEADLSQIFELYALLTKRTLLKSPQTPANVKVSLRNETPLTLEEGIDALNTILGLNGIAMVPQGEKFIKAVPAASVGPEVPPFSTNAPGELRASKAP